MSPKALALPPNLTGEGRGVGEGQEAEGIITYLVTEATAVVFCGGFFSTFIPY